MHPEILVRPGSSAGLVVTIAVSAAVHVMLIAFVVAAPGRFGRPPSPMESYTVELVASDSVGGTNLVAGSGASAAGKPAPAPAAAKDSEPAPAVVVEKSEPAPAVVVEKSEPAPAVVAEKSEPAPAVVAEKSEPAPAVVVEKSEPAPPVVAEKSEPVPAVVVEKSEPVPAVVVEKSEPAPPVVVEKSEPAPAAKVLEESPPAEDPDARIARAIAGRAALLASASDAEPKSSVDQQIAAAIRRRVAGQVAVGGESTSTPGGPNSYGPGAGAGGAIHDLEYIAYRGQMEARIKAAWAWAGADRSLVSVVGFNITPAGESVNVHTVKTSGDPSYDASAERAVLSANPLGPPPARYRREFWGVELEFRPEETRSR